MQLVTSWRKRGRSDALWSLTSTSTVMWCNRWRHPALSRLSEPRQNKSDWRNSASALQARCSQNICNIVAGPRKSAEIGIYTQIRGFEVQPKTDELAGKHCIPNLVLLYRVSFVTRANLQQFGGSSVWLWSVASHHCYNFKGAASLQNCKLTLWRTSRLKTKLALDAAWVVSLSVRWRHTQVCRDADLCYVTSEFEFGANFLE